MSFTVSVKPFDTPLVIEKRSPTVKQVLEALATTQSAPVCLTCVLLSSDGKLVTKPKTGQTYMMAHLTQLPPFKLPFAFPVTAKRKEVLETFLYKKNELDKMEEEKKMYTISLPNGSIWAYDDQKTLLEKGLPTLIVIEKQMRVKVGADVYNVCATTTVLELRKMVAAKIGRPLDDVHIRVPGIGREDLVTRMAAASMGLESTRTLVETVNKGAVSDVKKVLSGLSVSALMLATKAKTDAARDDLNAFAKRWK